MAKDISVSSVADNHVHLADLVIFPGSWGTISTYWGQSVLPLWTPSTNDVVEALNELPAFLEQQHESDVKKRLSESICQATGITFDGRKSIYINFFPAVEKEEKGVIGGSAMDWRTGFVRIRDGGSRWWRVVYLPEEKRFVGLHIDTGF